MVSHFRSILALVATSIFLSACSQDLSLTKNKQNLAEKVSDDKDVVVFPDYNPSIDDGKVVWDKVNCAQCHGKDGRGMSGLASNNLTNPDRRTGGSSPLQQYKLLTYGLPNWDHPVLKNKLDRREIWDLIFYVRSLESPPLTDKEVQKLEAVFGSNCADCHGIRGYGDGSLSNNINPLPANFHQFSRFYDRGDTMLFNHISDGLYPYAMPSFYDRQDKTNNVIFKDPLIKDLVRYVRHFSVAYKPIHVDSENLDRYSPAGESSPSGNPTMCKKR